MRQEEIERLLKKIEKSAQDVPVPEGLEPEQMMKKLVCLDGGYNQRAQESDGKQQKSDGKQQKGDGEQQKSDGERLKGDREQQKGGGEQGEDGRGQQKGNEKQQEISGREGQREWLDDGQNSRGRTFRKRLKHPMEYGVLAAAALITVLAVGQIQNANVAVDPGAFVETVTETAAYTMVGDGDEREEEWGGENSAVGKEYAAKSYREIFDKIYQYGQSSYNREEAMAGMDGAIGPTEAEAPAGGMGEASSGSDMHKESAMPSDSPGGEFSETNVQVEGVDEGDVVKTDGTYLYIMSSDSGRIQIVEANGSSPKKRGVITDSSTTMESRSIQEFYISGDRLSVIRQAFAPYEDGGNDRKSKSIDDIGEIDAVYCYMSPVRSITYLETYDISDRDNPKLLGTVTQDGTYKSSRRVDDYIYLFTSYYAYNIKNVKTTGSYIPVVNGKILPYDSIYIPEQVNGADYMVISSVDMKHPTKTADEKAVLSDGETFYVSPSNIYIGSTRYDGKADQYDYTELMKLSYRNGKITFKAHGNVDGYLNDQFSMDEYQGKLRLVSTLSYNSGNSTNSLLVLDEKLKVIGEIEDLAPGEMIYSARFMGDTGYFVTFRNMDPLFSVDLKNPADPKIMGELKITGFSEYLHPYDENLLLGIGREISPDTGNFKGLKLSMFDTSDPEDVKEKQKLVEKAYEYSPAWDNHKAAAISAGKNVIGFAVEEYDKTSRTWKYQYVVYSYDKGQGFKQVLSYGLQDDYNYGNVRGIYIGQYFYVVESSRVTVFDMKKFVKAGQVKY